MLNKILVSDCFKSTVITQTTRSDLNRLTQGRLKISFKLFSYVTRPGVWKNDFNICLFKLHSSETQLFQKSI